MHGTKLLWLGAAIAALAVGCAGGDGAMMSGSSSSLQTSFRQTRSDLDAAKAGLSHYRAGDRSAVDGVQRGVRFARASMNDVRSNISDAMMKCCQLSGSTMDTIDRGMETMDVGAAMMADTDDARNAAGIVAVESGMARVEEGMQVMSDSLSCMGPAL